MTAAPARVDLRVDVDALRMELDDERLRADQLAGALVSNRRIGVAIGLVMAQKGCSDVESFTALRQASMDSNRRLADVAEDVIGLRRLAEPGRSGGRR